MAISTEADMAGSTVRSGYMYEDECSIDRKLQGVAGAPRECVQHATGRGSGHRAGMRRGQKKEAGGVASQPLVGGG